MSAQCTGPLGSLMARRSRMSAQMCGRLLGRIMCTCPGLNILPDELLPWVIRADLLQSVPPLIKTAAYGTCTSSE